MLDHVARMGRPMIVSTGMNDIASVRKTHRLVVVQEGWPFSGVAAEISCRVYEKSFDWLDAPVKRVTNMDVPMPYAKNLEKIVLPSAEKIVQAVREVLYI